MDLADGESQKNITQIYMKANISMIRRKDLEYLNGQVEIFIWDIIKMMKEKE